MSSFTPTIWNTKNKDVTPFVYYRVIKTPRDVNRTEIQFRRLNIKIDSLHTHTHRHVQIKLSLTETGRKLNVRPSIIHPSNRCLTHPHTTTSKHIRSERTNARNKCLSFGKKLPTHTHTCKHNNVVIMRAGGCSGAPDELFPKKKEKFSAT